MVDVYITFAWILEDPLDRSRKFILHGLGQEKLYIENLKADFEASGEDTENHPAIQMMTEWVNSQRFTFLTDVNVGSWSGLSTRSMAQEAGCMDLYRFAYMPFSSAAHSMWNHVAKYNLEICENPLHRLHRVPVDSIFPIDPDYLYRAAKYLEKTFKAFDEKFEITIDSNSSFDLLLDMLNLLQTDEPDAQD